MQKDLSSSEVLRKYRNTERRKALIRGATKDQINTQVELRMNWAYMCALGVCENVQNEDHL